MSSPTRVIGVVGWHDAGKTTVLRGLIPALVAHGVRVSTVKHADHTFDVDTPGKDSFAHREAGAHEVLVASANRYALMHELRGESEPSLAALLARLDPVDLILVEGFKTQAHAKIEVHRTAAGGALLFPNDASICGLISDLALPPSHLPHARLGDVRRIADLVLELALPLDATLRELAAAAG